MLENFQGDSWGSIPPLRMPSLLPHDFCHGRSSSRWLPAIYFCVSHICKICVRAQYTFVYHIYVKYVWERKYNKMLTIVINVHKNIYLYPPLCKLPSIYISSYPPIKPAYILMHFKVNCRHQHSLSLNISSYMLTRIQYLLMVLFFFFFEVKFT